MLRFATSSVLALSLGACAATASKPQTAAAPPPAPVATAAPAPLADLVKAVDIPYESFTLPNGLTVLVHTDRKAPIVGDRKSTRLNSSHLARSRMPSSA